MEGSVQPVKRRKALSINDKAEIVARLKRGVPNARICEKYKLSSSTVSKIWRCRETIMTTFANNGGKIKKMRPCKRGYVDKALYKWYQEQLSANPNVVMTGPILIAQAESIARHSGDMDFKCTHGWITRFKYRHNIAFSSTSNCVKYWDGPWRDSSTGAKTLVVDHERDQTDWVQEVWTKLVDEYDPTNIFTMTQVGLLYKLMPDEFGNFRGETCEYGNLANSRVSLIIAVNMTGCAKRPLVVVGKPQAQKCFGEHKNLGVRYENDERSWITSKVSCRAIIDWDKELRESNTRILVLLDNSPAHGYIQGLTNINLVFLPVHLMSMMQPIAHGIAKSFKYQYRKRMVTRYLDCLDSHKCDRQKVSLLEAVRMMVEAWISVSADLIQFCFKKSGLCKPDQKSVNESSMVDLSWQDWPSESNIHLNLPEVDDYAGFDDHLVVAKSDAEIAKMVKECTNHDDSSDDEEDNSVHTSTSISEAIAALKVLRSFYETNSVDNEFFKRYMELKTIVDTHHLKNQMKK